jgi:hypothetical protein
MNDQHVPRDELFVREWSSCPSMKSQLQVSKATRQKEERPTHLGPLEANLEVRGDEDGSEDVAEKDSQVGDDEEG